jgi:hypothetical protein
MQYTSREVYEYISNQNRDPIVEWKICVISWAEFPIYQSDLDFYAKVSPTFNWQKFQIPTPTLCPEERQRRRMTWKNDHYYFKRVCDFSGESAVSIYHPSVPGPVYKVKYWRSDQRDAKDYAQDYDFAQCFWTQYKRLHDRVPKIAMVNDDTIGSENCEYCQNIAYSKDCYLNTVSWKLRDCYYSSNMATGELLIDSFFTMDSKICYECVEGYNLYECFYCSRCESCTRCRSCYDLHGCQDCAFCVWLVNQQYCLFNEQLTKDEYEKQIWLIHREWLIDAHSYLDRYEWLLAYCDRHTMHLVQTQDSYGNNLVNTDHTIFSYNLKNAQYCKYRWFGDTGTHAQDLTVGGELELCYEGIVPDNSYQAGFTVFCWKCSDVWYSEMCHSCQHCFWCIGLKNQSYCIFNKQFSKEEYEIQVGKIIQHMMQSPPNPQSYGQLPYQGAMERWEFFPSELSPFAYNHTIAQDYFSQSKENIVSQWLQWIDEETEFNVPVGTIVIPWDQLDRNPHTIGNSILSQAIRCVESGRPFRIMSKELEFYRTYSIPLPIKHPLMRYRSRLKQMPEKRLAIPDDHLMVWKNLN